MAYAVDGGLAVVQWQHRDELLVVTGGALYENGTGVIELHDSSTIRVLQYSIPSSGAGSMRFSYAGRGFSGPLERVGSGVFEGSFDHRHFDIDLDPILLTKV